MASKRIALVTGASSGLGSAFAEHLAMQGYDLILTSRGATAMETLAARIKSSANVDVIVEPADLSEPGGCTALTDALDRRGISPSVVINNAGFGLNERFADHDADRLTSMLELNIGSLTKLTHFYGRRMMAADGGHILLVASLAAHMPAPLMAAYAASKAYVLSLGEALHVEFAPKVGVCVLSPGYMETGFDAVSGFEPTAATRRTALATTEVARLGLDSLFAGKSAVVAGRANKAAATILKLLPRAFIARQAAKASGMRYREQ